MESDSDLDGCLLQSSIEKESYLVVESTQNLDEEGMKEVACPTQFPFNMIRVGKLGQRQIVMASDIVKLKYLGPI